MFLSLASSQCAVPIDDSAPLSSIGGISQMINGVSYGVQSAELDHSIRKAANTLLYRFEVREGEGRVGGGDAGKERSELSGGSLDFASGTSIWVAYCFMVESGSTWTGMANVLGQFHAGVGSPNLSLRVPNDDQLEVVMRTGDASAYTQLVPYSSSSFEKNRWYRVVINAKFTADTTGFVHIWLDGTQIVNVNNYQTGYQAAQSSSNYWKFGIYRSTSAPPVEAVRYMNMELGTASLSSRATELCCSAAVTSTGAQSTSSGSTMTGMPSTTAAGATTTTTITTTTSSSLAGVAVPLCWALVVVGVVMVMTM